MRKEDDKKVISVVIPVYNAESYIERCLQSIIRQCYTHLEILVVDDGSIDKSYEICTRMAKEDNRIWLIKNDSNKGVTSARNVGIEHASGDYITFVDADDYLIYDNYYLEVLENCGSADVVLMDYSDDDGNIHRQPLALREYDGKAMDIVYRKLFFDGEDNITANVWDKLFSAEIIKKNCQRIDKNIYYGEDKCLVVACMLDAAKVCNTGINGYNYTIRENSVVHSIHDDYLINLGRWYCQIKKIICEDEKCNEEYLLDGLEKEITIHLTRTVPKILGLKESNGLALWHYPYFGRFPSKKIVLWGANIIGQAYRYHIISDRESELVLWVDKNWKMYRKKGYDVRDWEEIKKVKFDYIILAVRSNETADEIKQMLEKINISHEKVVWSPTRWV